MKEKIKIKKKIKEEEKKEKKWEHSFKITLKYWKNKLYYYCERKKYIFRKKR